MRSCGRVGRGFGPPPPPCPAAGEELLDDYFASRAGSASAVPEPDWGSLVGCVLEPFGSAPGHDGIPYEVYHAGPRFVACLLGQCFHAANISQARLDDALGPAIDLLVWIMKVPDAECASGMRPLQLPSCFRRLFGAALASVAGPVVEPLLSNDQIAKSGG